VTIVNRRNAVLGWATWKVGKRAARRKAKGAAPSVEGGRPNASAAGLMAAGVAAGAAGAATVWRKRRNDDSD
jgi:hypothetical protein